jgi:hypothetical protein
MTPDPTDTECRQRVPVLAGTYCLDCDTYSDRMNEADGTRHKTVNSGIEYPDTQGANPARNQLNGTAS